MRHGVVVLTHSVRPPASLLPAVLAVRPRRIVMGVSSVSPSHLAVGRLVFSAVLSWHPVRRQACYLISPIHTHRFCQLIFPTCPTPQDVHAHDDAHAHDDERRRDEDEQRQVRKRDDRGHPTTWDKPAPFRRIARRDGTGRHGGTIQDEDDARAGPIIAIRDGEDATQRPPRPTRRYDEATRRHDTRRDARRDEGTRRRGRDEAARRRTGRGGGTLRAVFASSFCRSVAAYIHEGGGRRSRPSPPWKNITRKRGAGFRHRTRYTIRTQSR